ncbi:MAG: aldehyde ferredoxin oxidoreductase C-terminal domain-containing protein [Anaerolineae bacterium]|jgi:aldehyde:ferredoxin oxidoreductase|nr:aldehyde ferredoxin oxidoreductase C-terminal domain-containing protein [Anaerolineae bacterium]MDX9829692.1 aldehyde ferredoxin oxidoreductase C-terminal domain-containing protein [Anaerolineae bacterium]
MNKVEISKERLEELRAGHRVLAELRYEPSQVEKGYAGQTLHVDVSKNTITLKPVDEKMKRTFIGGRGFDLWLLWNAVNGNTRWDSPENEVVIAAGPIGGITQYPGTGKSIAVSISPLTGSVVDSNVGGYYGPLLKFSGMDAIEVQGIAQEEVIVFVDGNEGVIQIIAAPHEAVNSNELAEEVVALWGNTPAEKQGISSVSAGLGAEHTLIGCLNFSFYDPRRQVTRLKQAGRGGIGTVLRKKKVKALVVKYEGVSGDSNQPEDLASIQEAGSRMHREIYKQDPIMYQMRVDGTNHLQKIMNDYDILPVHNFRYGSHPEADKIYSPHFQKYFDYSGPDGCWYGCTMACAKFARGLELRSGPFKGQKVCVDGPEYETVAGIGANCGIWDAEAVLEANFYCDAYGIDTISFATAVAFAMECFEEGILNPEITGGLALNFGNADAMLEALHQMARGEGFGTVIGQGIRRMKKLFAEKYGGDPHFLQDIGMEAKGLEYSEYVTKESLAQQAGYGLANKGPQHDEAWLIFMDAVNNQIPTFADKAEALHYFPMWRTWFGLNGLCKLPWNDVEPADNRTRYSGLDAAKVPEHTENYVTLFKGMTGRKDVQSGEDLVRMSEAVYNFQRLFNLKMGFGTREHDAIPYRSMGPVTDVEYESRAERYDEQLQTLVGIDPTGMSTTEKRLALRRHREGEYEKLIDAVYTRRGWNANGIPTLETVRALGIDFPDIVALVEKHGG